MTRIGFVTQAEVDAAIPRVIEHLRADGLIAYPTETVYGFGGAATPAAASALQVLKQREAQKPFLLLISDIAQAPSVKWTAPARRLAQLFWPGPLTLALPATAGSLPPGVVSAEGLVALRATPHDAIRRLIATLGAPLTSTSANARGRPAARSAGEAEAALNELDATDVLVLDGGLLPPSPPSTVVACGDDHVRVLREGAITRAQLHDRLDGTGIDVR